jgi:phage baseplate assembly protein W
VAPLFVPPVFLPHLGNDLLVTPFFEADEWDTVDLTTNPRGTPYRDEPVDLALARGVENLQQALILRLLTPVGSLSALGHASYGSRLHELIGQENVEASRLRARVYVLQAIAQERRVEKVLSLTIAAVTADAPHTLRIAARVQPVGGGDPVALGLEVAL